MSFQRTFNHLVSIIVNGNLPNLFMKDLEIAFLMVLIGAVVHL